MSAPVGWNEPGDRSTLDAAAIRARLAAVRFNQNVTWAEWDALLDALVERVRVEANSTSETTSYKCGQCSWAGPNPVHVHHTDVEILYCPRCWHEVGRIDWPKQDGRA
jgi:hypothetical protein